MKSYIQPFEQRLALQELASLTGSKPVPLQSHIYNETHHFRVTSRVSADKLATSLAYWESVGKAKTILTTQVIRESTVSIVRNKPSLERISESIPSNGNGHLPNRRCLRYGTHGIHEYRGKFFPQLVRSLLNISGAPSKGLVGDPMSGSGTTLVEATLGGYHALGLDINPLSVLITRTKCALLVEKPEVLVNTYYYVYERLKSRAKIGKADELSYFSSLPEEDQLYLSRWFSTKILISLDKISQTINSIERGCIYDFLRLSLSNILRKVSFQKEDDLRVRKDRSFRESINPIEEFLEELERSIRSVCVFLEQNKNNPVGKFHIQEDDARQIPVVWQKWLKKIDVIITSPPYAMALPYLDTDRLSLSYLGLLSRPQHRVRDNIMIGNREVSEKIRQKYWSLFLSQEEMLPRSVVTLIKKIEDLNSNSKVGFRRRNLPPLLAKYFLDIREVLHGFTHLLKPRATAFLVVGNNHTIAGGERVNITTAELLVDIAKTVGLELSQKIPMDMLVSRDIFKKNAVKSEVILSFRNKI